MPDGHRVTPFVVAGQRVTTVELRADDSAPARARRAVRGLVAGEERLERHLQLLTTELVTNAVRHGAAGPADRIRLRAARTSDAVRVAVCDPARGEDAGPRLRHPDLRAGTGGLGLRLVEALATRWGTQRTPAGRRTWFELAVG